jgi:adenylate cyclase
MGTFRESVGDHASSLPDPRRAIEAVSYPNRRLVAVLFADACGYSRATAEDEVGTTAVLLEHRRLMIAVVLEHGGRPVSSAGDDLLAEFGGVAGAVRAALAVQIAVSERNRSLPMQARLLFG